jgi:hypothetical protein
MKSAFVCAFAVCLSASAAFGQTAEEAVAYAFMGLADEATLTRGKTTMSWKESAASPATFDGDAIVNGKRAKIKFTVAATSKCEYEVTLDGPPEMVSGSHRLYARIDLRTVTDVAINPEGFKATIGGRGFCETGMRNPTCMSVGSSDLFGAVDAARHKEAVAFIRAEVCAPE